MLPLLPRRTGLTPLFDAEHGPYAKFTPDGGTAGFALQDRTQMAEVLGELAAEATGYRSLVVLRVDDVDRYCEEITGRGALLVHSPAPSPGVAGPAWVT
ncbi:putative lyase [Streptomyces formicae]|uniref:Putative lyase n=1 Tax=Streptomyces formicae TaxID=1616117 RepID=A0A291QNG9_9ACTN|nr:putative lyase [Streptomyces formicae]